MARFPNPSDMAMFTGKEDCTRWLKAMLQAWTTQGYTLATLPYSIYLDYIDTHLQGEAALYADRNPELNRLLNQETATLADLARVELILKARFPIQVPKEVDPETQLEQIAQKAQSLDIYYRTTVDVLHVFAPSLSATTIPVSSLDKFAMGSIVRKFIRGLTNRDLQDAIVSQVGIFNRPIAEVYATACRCQSHLNQVTKSHQDQQLQNTQDTIYHLQAQIQTQRIDPNTALA